MDVWKVNEFNFLSEEVEEFTNRWSQTWLILFLLGGGGGVKLPPKPRHIS